MVRARDSSQMDSTPQGFSEGSHPAVPVTANLVIHDRLLKTVESSKFNSRERSAAEGIECDDF